MVGTSLYVPTPLSIRIQRDTLWYLSHTLLSLSHTCARVHTLDTGDTNIGQ